MGDGMRGYARRQRVISAEDGTLKIWNLDGSRVLATLEGHRLGKGVRGDTRRPHVVSASKDRTSAWDHHGCVRASFEGHTDR
jgi:hypothetical protein